MEQEIWKDVKGYEGLYQVSNLGNVRSLDRYVNHPNNGFLSLKKGKILRKFIWGGGYYSVMFVINGKQKSYRVNRLVAQAFIDNPDNKPQVNHINGIKSDNRVENLEWVTAKENVIHSMVSGLNKNFGTNNHLSGFTKEDILYIRQNNTTSKELREKYNVSKTCINRIRRGETYKDLL